MQLINELQLDFSDVRILPKRSTLKSRKDVNITRDFIFKHSQKTWNGFPLIASNMLTGTFQMAKKLAEYDCMTALHKHYSVEELAAFWKNFPIANSHTFYSLGITDKDLQKYNNFCNLSKIRPNYINIDVANGYMEEFVSFIRKFRKDNPEVVIMAGNVVTGAMTEELILAGADIIKIGIGSGAQCSTRKITGVGRPQLSAVIDCADHAHGLGGLICSDGGITEPGDLCIAYGAGSDFAMIGSILSGTDECDGEFVEYNGKFHRKFFGMSSNSAMETFGNGKESYKSSEGRTTLVPCKGSATHVIQELQGGVRSMLSYIGARSLKEASKRTTLLRVNNTINKSFEKYTIGN